MMENELWVMNLLSFRAAFAGLERSTEYAFRVTAVTVNGTGPATDWATAETFKSDLDGERAWMGRQGGG